MADHAGLISATISETIPLCHTTCTEWSTTTCQPIRMQAQSLTREPAPSTPRALVIPRRWMTPLSKQLMLLIDCTSTQLMIAGMLLLGVTEGSLTSPINIVLPISIGIMLQNYFPPRVHVDAQTRRTGKLIQQHYLLGLKCWRRTLDISPYTHVTVCLFGGNLSLELEAPGRMPLTLTWTGQSGRLTKRHDHSDIRTFMRMSREIAQTLQIRDRKLQRYRSPFRRKVQQS